MYYTKIIVQYKDGSKPKGIRVSLGLPLGSTKDFYTNSDGTVIIEHSSKGKATIYVIGKNVGSLYVPGETVVFV